VSSSIKFVDLALQQDRIRPSLDRRIAAVLAHGKYIMGPEVAELEKALADWVGQGMCISCSSGTDALVMPLMAWDIGPGDAVFVPSFTFTASAEVILLLGATPIFVDVEPASFNIDVADLAARIAAVKAEGRLRPRAVMAVDLFGLPADYDAIHAVAKAQDMYVLADSAQSFGARAADGKPVGALADITSTSFFPAKPLGGYGDGGAVFTTDLDLTEKMRSIRVHGQGTEKYDVVRIGLNARLDTLQAAVLLAKLDIFAEEVEARNRVAARYSEGLKDVCTVPAVPAGVTSAWAQYTIRCANRDAVAAKLKLAGIPTAIYYPRPMHLQTAYLAYGEGVGSLPESERACGEVLSLPMHPYLTDGEIDAVVSAFRDAVAEAS